METIISVEKVKELLPQKAPFVMVNYLLDYTEETIVTGMKVNEDNLFVENGIFNESGMLENIAQSTALHTSYGYFLRKEEAPVGYIGSISNVKIHNYPTIDALITTEVRIIKEFMGVTMIEGKLLQNGEVMMETKMKTFLAEE